MSKTQLTDADIQILQEIVKGVTSGEMVCAFIDGALESDKMDCALQDPELSRAVVLGCITVMEGYLETARTQLEVFLRSAGAPTAGSAPVEPAPASPTGRTVN